MTAKLKSRRQKHENKQKGVENNWQAFKRIKGWFLLITYHKLGTAWKCFISINYVMLIQLPKQRSKLWGPPLSLSFSYTLHQNHQQILWSSASKCTWNLAPSLTWPTLSAGHCSSFWAALCFPSLVFSSLFPNPTAGITSLNPKSEGIVIILKTF